MDLLEYNRGAWDQLVGEGDVWTRPFSSEVLARARAGDWSLLLTPKKPVPRSWYPKLEGADVLGLASGGGQQCAVFGTLGAKVTVFDNSSRQLEQDRQVAEREGFEIRTVQGDMKDLSVFDDQVFDMVFHPCSNCFCDDVRPVWREAFRVLRPGGVLMAGFANPVIYTFDPKLAEQGTLTVKYSLPYSDVTSLTDEERRRWTDKNEPLVTGHTLEDQIGGQLAAGFVLTDMFEDTTQGLLPEDVALDKRFSSYIATRAIRRSV